MGLRLTRGSAAFLIVLVAVLTAGCGGTPVDRCVMCSKDLPSAGGVVVVAEDGTESRACCPHCGLRYAARATAARSGVTDLRARDYETGEPVRLAEAFFVYDSSTVPCCVPSVLVVGRRETAADLAAHGGGTVMDYEGLRAALGIEAVE